MYMTGRYSYPLGFRKKKRKTHSTLMRTNAGVRGRGRLNELGFGDGKALSDVTLPITKTFLSHSRDKGGRVECGDINSVIPLEGPKRELPTHLPAYHYHLDM